MTTKFDFTTATGCRVRTFRMFGDRPWDLQPGVYLHLNMVDPRDTRSAELRLSPAEAIQLGEALKTAGELDD